MTVTFVAKRPTCSVRSVVASTVRHVVPSATQRGELSHQVVTLAEKEKEDEDLPLSQSSILSQQGEMQIHVS